MAGNYMDVRARRYNNGRRLRHWVLREEGKPIADDAAALCGRTSRWGWVAMPTNVARDCDKCLRKAGMA